MKTDYKENLFIGAFIVAVLINIGIVVIKTSLFYEVSGYQVGFAALVLCAYVAIFAMDKDHWKGVLYAVATTLFGVVLYKDLTTGTLPFGLPDYVAYIGLALFAFATYVATSAFESSRSKTVLGLLSLCCVYVWYVCH